MPDMAQEFTMNPDDEAPTPRIEIVRYRGKRGSYAHKLEIIYLARAVGYGGRHMKLDQSTWHGKDLKHAEREAEQWAVMFGLPIVRIDATGHERGFLPPDPIAWDMKTERD